MLGREGEWIRTSRGRHMGWIGIKVVLTLFFSLSHGRHGSGRPGEAAAMGHEGTGRCGSGWRGPHGRERKERERELG